MEKPLWISHRGYKENAVENTAAAFRAAVDLGFSCLETDLRLTRDKRIVLIHDPTLARLAGDRRQIRDMTARELSGIRLSPVQRTGDPHAFPDFQKTRHAGVPADKDGRRTGDRAMFLDEFVAEFRDFRWVFDIKPETGAETIRELARWAEAEGMVEAIVQNAKILTWHADHETLATDRFPGILFYARRTECWRAGIAVLSGRPGLGRIRPGRTYALPPSFMGLSLFQTSMVRRFHERRARVVAFLPPTHALAERAAAAGFDEILTNLKKKAGV
jgi:glycerophosphoryl diester phosphodiesterase